jgi:hypothetical protein
MRYSFKTRLANLPLVSKFVLVGSFLAIIGVFLPWYKDIDTFNTGEMFLGITGPLYLAGIIVLLAGITSFGMIALRLFNKPIPKLPLKEDQFYVFTSSLSLLMLIMTISVFFHNKFGISLVDKSIGIGMMMAFIGSGLVMLGAIIAIKNQEINFEVEGHLEPLIELESEARDQKPLHMKKENVEQEAMKVKSAVQGSIEDFSEGSASNPSVKTVGDAIEESSRGLNNSLPDTKDIQ